jgi:hypothetical protein
MFSPNKLSAYTDPQSKDRPFPLPPPPPPPSLLLLLLLLLMMMTMGLERQARIGNMRKSYKMLLEKHEGKRPVRKVTVRWENNIKIGLKEMWCGVDRYHVQTTADTVMKLTSSIKCGNILNGRVTISAVLNYTFWFGDRRYV